MADILRRVFGLLNECWRDMGDGTHARVFSIGGTVPTSGGLTDLQLRARPVEAELTAGAAHIGEVTADQGAAGAEAWPVEAELIAGAAHIGEVGTWANVVQATLTRPVEAPAVQYTANDAVTDSLTASTAIAFANALRAAGQTGFVIGGRMRKSTVSVTNAQFRLHLFTAAPAAIANDNAAYAEAWANRLIYIGYIDFVSWRAGSDCAESPGILSRVVLGYKPTSGTSISGVMQVLAAYTPVSAEQFAISLDVVGS